MKRKKSKKSAVTTSMNNHNHNQKKIVFRNFEETPTKYKSKIDPINLEEQKYRFLHKGITPQFEFKTNHENVMDISNSKKGQIRFEYLSEATRILEKVKMKFGCGDHYMEEAYGESIECEHASAVVARYMKDSGVEGMLTVSWSKDLSCSGRMSWCGPCTRYNKPEARKYSLWIKNSVDNAFLREKGIKCLADHEIGTHFFRNLNDGLQPWFSDRPRFGLRALKSQALLETEEGLAAINTILQANHKFLFFPALTYYTACKAADMGFQELFDHLHMYIRDCNLRWKYVMRVKRGLQDTSDVGGYGKDQCYFTGAVEILKNLEKIDFNLLYSGKVCIDELPRVKRLARLDCLKLPHFLHNMEEYRKQLKYIANVNGLLSTSVKKSAKMKSGTGRRNSLCRQLSTRPSAKSVVVNDSSCTCAYEICDVQSDTMADQLGSNSYQTDTRICATESTKEEVTCYNICETTSQPQGDKVRISEDSWSTTQAKIDDLSTPISSAKSCPISEEYQESTYFPFPSQNRNSGYTYTWKSVRTPSPAMMVRTEESDTSPIPYSPARWLRRRKISSPNVLPRKQTSRDSLGLPRNVYPSSIVRF